MFAMEDELGEDALLGRLEGLKYVIQQRKLGYLPSINYGVFQAIFNDWKDKRKRWQKPILRRLQPPPPLNNTNPYNVFRPREKAHRLHTRRMQRRENNVQPFEKLRQEKEILCSARIVGISSRNGWQYVSCAKCAKKLVRSATTFLCNACNNYNAIGVVKFRVELLIDDGTGRSTFVIFDRDARKLTNTTAEDLNASKVTASDGHAPAEAIPLCIRELVGKSFQFHLKITKFNFTSRFQTFTITRVLQEISEGTNCSSPPQKVGAEQKTIPIESKFGSISPSTMESEDVKGSAKDKNPTGSGDEPTPPNIGDRVILPGQHSAKKIRLE